MGVATNRRGLVEIRGGFLYLGMNPIRVDLGQWPHDEGAVVSTRMRYDQTAFVDDFVAIGNQVQVKRARRVGAAVARPAGGGLDVVQQLQHSGGR